MQVIGNLIGNTKVLERTRFMWENGIAAKIDKLEGIFGGVIIDKIKVHS